MGRGMGWLSFVARLRRSPCPVHGGSFFPVGTTDVVCVVADASSNSDPPVLDCPGPIAVSADVNACCAVVPYPVSAVDLPPGGPLPRLECIPSPGYCFEVGTTEVECKATDAVGNESVCTFTITEIDDQTTGDRGVSATIMSEVLAKVKYLIMKRTFLYRMIRMTGLLLIFAGPHRAAV